VSPLAVALDLLGVLLAALLLGVGAWMAGIAILGWVVTRETLSTAALVLAAAGLAAAAVVYIGLTIALTLALPA